MNYIKKMLAVVMTFVLLVSCLVVGASALTYAPGSTSGDMVITVKADKTTVSPGDVVTFELCIDSGSKTNLYGFGNLIFFNSNQITAVGSTVSSFRTYVGDCANFGNQTSNAGNMNFAVSTNAAIKKNLTADEQAYYNKGIMVTGGSTSTANRWNPSAGEAYMTFQMTVSDSVQPGDEIWIGVHEAGFKINASYFQYYNDGTAMKRSALTDLNLTNSMLKLTVAAAEEPSIVNPLKGQIRFHKDAAGAYANSFDVRALAVIEGNDFTTTFGDIAAAKTKIKEVGFVFAQGANVTAPSMDAVKALVENGTAAAGYTKKTVNYISTSVEPGSYVFSCIAAGIPDAEKTNSLVAVGYIAWDSNADGEVDSYAYYPTAQTISFKQLYNVNNDQANANYGWNLQDIA